MPVEDTVYLFEPQSHQTLRKVLVVIFCLSRGPLWLSQNLCVFIWLHQSLPFPGKVDRYLEDAYWKNRHDSSFGQCMCWPSGLWEAPGFCRTQTFGYCGSLSVNSLHRLIYLNACSKVCEELGGVGLLEEECHWG